MTERCENLRTHDIEETMIIKNATLEIDDDLLPHIFLKFEKASPEMNNIEEGEQENFYKFVISTVFVIIFILWILQQKHYEVQKKKKWYNTKKLKKPYINKQTSFSMKNTLSPCMLTNHKNVDYSDILPSSLQSVCNYNDWIYVQSKRWYSDC